MGNQQAEADRESTPGVRSHRFATVHSLVACPQLPMLRGRPHEGMNFGGRTTAVCPGVLHRTGPPERLSTRPLSSSLWHH